jgi:hypothetical protein
LKIREKLKEKRVRERERVKSVSEREGRRKVFLLKRRARKTHRKEKKKFSRKLEYFDIYPDATININSDGIKLQSPKHEQWNTNWLGLVSAQNQFKASAQRCPFSYRRNPATNARTGTIFGRIMPCTK